MTGQQDALLRGVAANPAAGVDVLVRLLAAECTAARPVLRRRPLPAGFVALLLDSPERSLRALAAGNPHLTADQIRRVARDRECRVVFRLLGATGGAFRAAHRATPLPADVLDLLLLGTAEREAELLTPGEYFGELASGGHLDAAYRRRLATHPEPALRRAACGDWGQLGDAARESLLADPDPEVRAAAHEQAHPDLERLAQSFAAAGPRERRVHCWMSPLPPEVLETLLAAREELPFLAVNPHLPSDAVRRLAADPDPAVRRAIAERPDLDAESVTALAADPDPGVRRRAELLPRPRTRGRARLVSWLLGTDLAKVDTPVPEPVDDPGLDWYLACAASPDPVLRRAAAVCRELDPATVRLLAADPDRDVRLLLALRHPDAPPALLLDAYLHLPNQRPYLLLRPAFPRAGLPVELAAHPDPQVRQLLAGDPEFDAAALLDDPDPDVRRTAAAHPRLPVAGLLADPGTAPDLLEGAAANPQLTERHLHALLDRAGAPARR